MRFTKMHGIGNDYIYVNEFSETVRDPIATAKVISDRHRGIGGDGLILIGPPEAKAKKAGAVVRMRMFNADGSESEMCGNGVRCVCKYAYDHEITPGIRDANPMLVQTGRGVLSLRYTLERKRVDMVTVDMGEPILKPEEIPVDIKGVERVVDLPFGKFVPVVGQLPLDWGKPFGFDWKMTAVSVGNPHLILYCTDVAKVPLEQVGPVLERHKVFPKRINVHFVQVHSAREVTMRTWERGSGITQACGTGASAVCVAGVLTRRTDPKITAHLPGGDLRLHWDPQDNHVYMTGPATEVFNGEWNGS